jgi:transcriptional regulator with XRE-family HTH domain
LAGAKLYSGKVDNESAVLTILTSSRGRNAIASGNYGSVIRLVRQGLGLHQIHLATRAGYSQSTISRIEQNQLVNVMVLRDVCEALDIPLGTIFGNMPSGVALERPNLEDMERRALLKATLGAASAAMLPLAVSDPTPGRRIGISVVRESWAALGRLQAVEGLLGGGVVFDLTAGMATRLRRALNSANYSAAVGRGLSQVTAETMIRAGWQAFDGGRLEVARSWWLETLHFCDLGTGAEQWRPLTLAALALEASKSPGRGREVVELTQLAAQVGGASPAMLSLIAARESLGHAWLGDEAAAASALTRANKLLDHSRSDDEPRFLRSWGPADLACHEMTAARNLGQGSAQVRAAQQTVELCDPAKGARNHALYLAYLGHALAQAGRYDEAIAPLQAALTSPARDGSHRITKQLRTSGQILGKSTHAPARDFAVVTNRLLPTQ